MTIYYYLILQISRQINLSYIKCVVNGLSYDIEILPGKGIPRKIVLIHVCWKDTKMNGHNL